MCLAIYKPSKVLPDWDALEEGFKSNAHGAGFAVAVDGSIQVHKGFFTFDDFARAYMPLEDKQALVHFRWATHGARDAEMCHPFMVSDEIAMIHNGILNISTDDDKTKSDTWHYVEYILKPLAERDRDFYSDNSIRFLGESAISGSKFCFLRADGDWQIWNSEDGHWHGDAWYSNRSYAKSIGYSQNIGYTRWPKETEETPLDIPVYEDTGESRYYDSLTKSGQWLYEDLLEDGFSASELDEYIHNEGEIALRYLKRHHNKYDEENV
jgi:glutamine amidotransferase